MAGGERSKRGEVEVTVGKTEDRIGNKRERGKLRSRGNKETKKQRGEKTRKSK